ncbi:imidazolonepropionase [Thiotrichales bacterium 19S3-11]|nr:imidazolonepropionase [Thiotrichales bacterium 19S3-11]
MSSPDLLIKNARLLTVNDSYDILDRVDIAIKDTKVIAIDNAIEAGRDTMIIDTKGALVSPGLIDCHTHIIYAGNRADEFAMRLNGASYQDIAQQGGGILLTVTATRKASIDELTALALKRLDTMANYGVTTVEVKSGYGLDTETEIKMLKVTKRLANHSAISIVSTFLGAHAIPPEFKKTPEIYLDLIINQMLPEIKEQKLAEFVDAFCESIAFKADQVEKLFNKAKAYGFKLKLHAEQLSDQKGAKLAASMGAYSVDHLEYLNTCDIRALKENNTTAVLLPGAFYFLKETQLPPIDALRKQQVPIAIATDANPGSSPFLSLPLMMNMACVLFGLSIKEVWQAVTINAAKALDRQDRIGSVEVAKTADLVIWDTNNENDIVYNPTGVKPDKVIKEGVFI